MSLRSTFFGLDLARRAISVNQKAIDITGHNIANANTEGYSRQVVTMTASKAYTNPSLYRPTTPGQVGTGVEVEHITRMQDKFITNLIWQETQNYGRWEARSNTFSQIEMIFGEPSDEKYGSGIAFNLGKLWESFNDLAGDPENTGVRATVSQRAIVLTDTVRQIYSQLSDLHRDTSNLAQVKVNEANTLLNQIASLNNQIGKVIRTGDQPNDLMDRRDNLVKQLSGLMDVRVDIDKYGQYNISVSGISVVRGDQFSQMEAVIDPSTGIINDIRWPEYGASARISVGELAGLLEANRDIIPSYLDKLDEFASGLRDSANAIHRAGFGQDGSTGLDFFIGTGARDISINPDLTGELGVKKIAASTVAGSDGNGENARLLYRLHTDLVMNSNTDTIDGYFNAMIAALGVDAQQAERMSMNQETVLGHLQNWSDSVSSVSMDEEMANLVKFQHSYNAAARYISTIDEMLDLVITRMGLVGR